MPVFHGSTFLPQLYTPLPAAYYQQKAAKLGPDPLRGDADGELLWQKMRVSKKPIGALLMDQSAVAGIGNIYRAEILFKVHMQCTFTAELPNCTRDAATCLAFLHAGGCYADTGISNTLDVCMVLVDDA